MSIIGVVSKEITKKFPGTENTKANKDISVSLVG